MATAIINKDCATFNTKKPTAAQEEKHYWPKGLTELMPETNKQTVYAGSKLLEEELRRANKQYRMIRMETEKNPIHRVRRSINAGG